MPSRLVNIDRSTPMFLPPDLRDWVPQDHLVHFVIDAVEALPLSQFRINHRGTGSEQYPPRMLLALLIYCYATGSGTSTGTTVYAAQGRQSHHRSVLDLPGGCPKRSNRGQ